MRKHISHLQEQFRFGFVEEVCRDGHVAHVLSYDTTETLQVMSRDCSIVEGQVKNWALPVTPRRRQNEF